MKMFQFIAIAKKLVQTPIADKYSAIVILIFNLNNNNKTNSAPEECLVLTSIYFASSYFTIFI